VRTAGAQIKFPALQLPNRKPLHATEFRAAVAKNRCCRSDENRSWKDSYLSMPNHAAWGFTLGWPRWHNGRHIKQREVAANRRSQGLPRRHWVLEGRIGISFCPRGLVRWFSGWDVAHVWGDQHQKKSLFCLSRIRRTEEIDMIDGIDGRA
jgi:hypothetical protein